MRIKRMGSVGFSQFGAGGAGAHEGRKARFDSLVNIHGLHIFILLKKFFLNLGPVTAIRGNFDKRMRHVATGSELGPDLVGAELALATEFAQRELIGVPEEEHEKEDRKRDP